MPLMYYIGKLNASLLNFVVCVFPCLYPRGKGASIAGRLRMFPVLMSKDATCPQRGNKNFEEDLMKQENRWSLLQARL